jgi:1-acyl-sn-glycerol-3-phosphate acyltransferase
MTEDARSRLGRSLFAAYEYLAMVAGLGCLAVICALWLPFATLLQPLLPERWGRPIGRLAICLGFRAYLGFLSTFCACRFDLSALDRLRDEGPLVLVANHPSLLDAVMIVSRLPNAVCIMKAALMNNVLLGAGARLARYIRNDAPLKMIRHASEALGQGAQLVIFPEGTRTAAFPVTTFGSAACMIARRGGAPLQTVFIEFNSPYLGKAWPLFRKPQLPLHFRIRLGERFVPPKDIAGFTRQLEQYFRDGLDIAGPRPQGSPGPMREALS